MKKSSKRMVVMLLLVGGLFAALIGYQRFVGAMMQQFLAANANPPATVTAMVVQRSQWQPEIRAIGSLRAIQGVDLRTEIIGVVEKIHFSSGEWVEQGMLLLELNQAEEQARLKALDASLRLAQINYQRDQQQFKINAISQAQLDGTEAELNSLQAQVAQQQAVIRKRQIRAPFSGRLGLSTVVVGQLLNPGESIVTLQNTQQLYVDFNLPQKQLGSIELGQTIALQSEVENGVEAKGTLSAINTVVDAATRNIRVEGLVDNREQKLLPGMFVHLRVLSGDPGPLLTLPQTAISYNAYGSTLFLVRDGADGERPIAERVFVTVGGKRGDQVSILNGVAEGDQVVTSGQMKLKNGTPLIINNQVLPANEIDPQPQEQ